MRARKGWMLGLVGAVVVVGAGGTWLALRPADAAAATTTATVTSSTFSTTVSASGTVTPAKQSDLTFPSGGTVSSVLVAAGDVVTKGQVLARMDAAALQAKLDAAGATLDAAQSQLDSDEDDSASDTQLAADRAQVASASSSLTSAQDDVDGATLRAPFKGTVSAVDVAVGDSTGSSQSGTGSASSTASTSGSTSGITVISTKKYVVDATVGSSDVAQLKKGLQAQVTPTGSTSTVYGVVQSVGVIAESSDSATGSSSAAAFPVTIRVTGTTDGLYAGSSATVSIIVSQKTDVLAVPTQAITSSGGKAYVKKMVGSKAVRTEVTLGQAYGAQTEVTKGLVAGDKVQLTGFSPPGVTGNRSGQQRERFGEGGGGFPSGGFGGGAPQ
ncbi:MAG: HlyD family efflux transporter periplasmic adaptor subunit [Nocardioidaceae bacterium]|nr:HlyD family efflux transporter periplasmic adaptor subunit [Nocardioidaceae bacterium]